MKGVPIRRVDFGPTGRLVPIFMHFAARTARIPVVDSTTDRHVVAERALWAAAALAAVGGVGPLLAAAGHTNRIGGVVFPFAVAAIAMVVISFTYRRGRAYSALVFFLAGLAIAYGLLLVMAVPLRLAVEGACPPAPTRCAAGLELQLTGPENTGVTIAVAFGVLSLFAGFIGLAMLYRHRAAAAPAPTVWPERPPEKAVPATISSEPNALAPDVSADGAAAKTATNAVEPETGTSPPAP